MSNQLSIFDAQQGEEARDDALRRIWENASAWQLTALQAVKRCAEQNPEFIVDRVWEYVPEDDHPHDLRAMGIVMRVAVRAGWIEGTSVYQPSERITSHRNPRRVWRSLIARRESA